MNNEEYKTFVTKTGFCHVYSDKIILSREGKIGDLSKIVVGNNIKRVLIIYGLTSIFSFYKTYATFLDEDYVFSILFALLGLFFVYGIFKSLNNSATPIIYRNVIKEVKFIKAKPNLTRAYFEVYFTDEKNILKKRLIMLPSSFSNGKSETEKALKIFKEEGLIS